MKLTAQQVFDVTPVLTAIINEKRPMPLKGAYRLARMHARLAPEFNVVAAQRDAIIVALLPPDVNTVGASVPLERMPEFNEQWGAIASEIVDVEVEPIPLALLDLGDTVAGSLSAADLVALGELVTE